jgi:hypothetical protein
MPKTIPPTSPERAPDMADFVRETLAPELIVAVDILISFENER